MNRTKHWLDRVLATRKPELNSMAKVAKILKIAPETLSRRVSKDNDEVTILALKALYHRVEN